MSHEADSMRVTFIVYCRHFVSDPVIFRLIGCRAQIGAVSIRRRIGHVW